MSRRSRLKLDGIPIHIIQRGNNRNACFYADEDYQFYLESLDGYCHDEKVKEGGKRGLARIILKHHNSHKKSSLTPFSLSQYYRLMRRRVFISKIYGNKKSALALKIYALPQLHYLGMAYL